MRNRITPLLLLTLCLCLAFPSTSAALSARGKSTLRNMQIALRNLQKDPKLFDGKQIVPGARLDRLENHKRVLISNINRAVRYWNRLSAADRADPEAKKAGAKLDEMMAYAKALEKAVKGASQASASADKACRDFEKEAMKSVDRQAMVGLVGLLGDKGKVTYGQVDHVKKAVEAAKAIAAFCAKPQYKDVGKTGCRWMKVGGRDRDPSAWCEAAAKYQELVKQGVMNFVAQQGRTAGAGDVKPDELAKRDGWLTFEGPVTYKGHLFFGEEAKKRLMDKLGPMFAAAGMDNLDDPSLWEAQKAQKDALRAKVDELAPTWKPYRTVGKDYGCGLAKRVIKKWHRKARIAKVGLRDKSWHIRKNALGVPLERTRQGIVFFKIPGEKWCQARSYILTETYKGGGRYQKANGVRIGYVRFQKGCK